MTVCIVPASVTPRQIEVPAEVTDRSRKGAIHIRPASTITLTDAELDFIREKYPAIAKLLIVVPERSVPMKGSDMQIEASRITEDAHPTPKRRSELDLDKEKDKIELENDKPKSSKDEEKPKSGKDEEKPKKGEEPPKKPGDKPKPPPSSIPEDPNRPIDPETGEPFPRQPQEPPPNRGPNPPGTTEEDLESPPARDIPPGRDETPLLPGQGPQPVVPPHKDPHFQRLEGSENDKGAAPPQDDLSRAESFTANDLEYRKEGALTPEHQHPPFISTEKP